MYHGEKQQYVDSNDPIDKPAKEMDILSNKNGKGSLKHGSSRNSFTTTLTLNGGLDTYQKLIDDDERTTNFTFKELSEFAPGYYNRSIPLIFNKVNPVVLNMLSMYYISYFGDSVLTAGFGLGNSLFMAFFMTFIFISCETSGIFMSKALGAQDFKTMRLQFYRGIIFNLFIAFFACLMFIKMDSILIAIGLDKGLSVNATLMCQAMIPALILQSINEMIKNLLVSQGVYKPFLYVNLMTFIFFPIGGYYLIWKFGLGIIGFGIFKFLVECINFVGIVVSFI